MIDKLLILTPKIIYEVNRTGDDENRFKIEVG